MSPPLSVAFRINPVKPPKTPPGRHAQHALTIAWPNPSPSTSTAICDLLTKTLDNSRSAVYSTGVLSSSGQSATGVQVAGTFLNVLELETAFRVCDLTPQEAEAYRLSVFTGLDREEVAEALSVTPRTAGNLIGKASRKLVNYVYDHPLRDLLA
jgi:predicted DNA-binding protein (UPF0251 family)